MSCPFADFSLSNQKGTVNRFIFSQTETRKQSRIMGYLYDCSDQLESDSIKVIMVSLSFSELSHQV